MERRERRDDWRGGSDGNEGIEGRAMRDVYMEALQEGRLQEGWLQEERLVTTVCNFDREHRLLA